MTATTPTPSTKKSSSRPRGAALPPVPRTAATMRQLRFERREPSLWRPAGTSGVLEQRRVSCVCIIDQSNNGEWVGGFYHHGTCHRKGTYETERTRDAKAFIEGYETAMYDPEIISWSPSGQPYVARVDNAHAFRRVAGQRGYRRPGTDDDSAKWFEAGVQLAARDMKGLPPTGEFPKRRPHQGAAQDNHQQDLLKTQRSKILQLRAEVRQLTSTLRDIATLCAAEPQDAAHLLAQAQTLAVKRLRLLGIRLDEA